MTGTSISPYDVDELVQVAEQLRIVDEATWRAALPDATTETITSRSSEPSGVLEASERSDARAIFDPGGFGSRDGRGVRRPRHPIAGKRRGGDDGLGHRSVRIAAVHHR